MNENKKIIIATTFLVLAAVVVGIAAANAYNASVQTTNPYGTSNYVPYGNSNPYGNTMPYGNSYSYNPYSNSYGNYGQGMGRMGGMGGMSGRMGMP